MEALPPNDMSLGGVAWSFYWLLNIAWPKTAENIFENLWDANLSNEGSNDYPNLCDRINSAHQYDGIKFQYDVFESGKEKWEFLAKCLKEKIPVIAAIWAGGETILSLPLIGSYEKKQLVFARFTNIRKDSASLIGNNLVLDLWMISKDEIIRMHQNGATSPGRYGLDVVWVDCNEKQLEQPLL